MTEEFVLKWGICSAGRISNDFVICLNMLPNDKHQIVAVAARDKAKAEQFSKDHSIAKAYGSYQDIASDSSINVVYIGSIHTEHYKLSRMMLEAGKHVLCEKPLCVTLKQTQSLVKIAKAKQLFLMEGIWSRCFPAYAEVRRLLRDEVIGPAQHVQVQFGEYSETLVPRIREKDQAGGALLDRGLYAVQFAQFVFNEKPIEQAAFGSLLKETGVDTACHIYMKFSDNRTALASTSILASLPNEAIICGPNGTIKVCFPFWCPTRVEVAVKYSDPQVYEFSLPDESKRGRKMIFRNSEGFVYEAEHVRDCIMKGLSESPLISLEMTLQIAEIMDSARREIGYSLPQDDEQY